MTIVVNDVTQATHTKHELEKQLEQSERLIEANRQLEQSNQDLTEINEELQSDYENALVTIEEAQSATEEVETLNEELNATNEELETLNEELQATIEELNATNDDLSARSAELEDLARSREEEHRKADASRRLLEVILQNISEAALAVDAEGEELFSNDLFKEAFREGTTGEADGGIGLLVNLRLLDENGERLPAEATPQARAARGESFRMRFAIEEEGTARRRFEAEGHPTDDEVGGGVIIIREER